MSSINPHEVYTAAESKELLKVSSSTMKRLLKSGFVRANKIGGQYRIMGKELLRLLSPSMERGAVKTYQKIKKRIKSKIKNW
ncbi:MAG: helix-turn-helix domain-containing protein [Candidatus Yanofskybacteria bacterium]|nr:helix-turn-helix domain-containing protein [Candidatus Yanofskybacteria bacterium]